MSLDLLDTNAMNAPPVRCLNALSAALFGSEHILNVVAAWNQSAEVEAKQKGSTFEPVTVFQLLAVAQEWLDKLEPSNPQYPFANVVHSLLHATAEAMKAESATQQIAAANDFMRKHPGLGGEWELSPAVAAMSEREQQQLIQKVIAFDDFKPEQDPFRSHDRGVILHNGERYEFWIDYFHRDPQAEAEERDIFPENLSEVKRVLTLMRSSEHQMDFC